MDPPKPQVDAFTVVHRRYLNVIPTPCYVDETGRIWLERAWNQDVLAHLAYLEDFVLCAPRQPRGSEADLVRFETPPGARISFVHLPPQTSFLGALLRFPRTVAMLWRAIGAADVVHSGIGGWPYPLGWIANPIALLRGKRLLVNVESDWRLTAPGRNHWRQRLANMDPLRDFMARWSCDHAHLALFTHVNYRDQLCTKHPERAFVSPAVWVNEADVVDSAVAELAWEAKRREPVRLLFAGRLVVAKGVEVLLAALRALDARGVEARVDIIGRGEAESACRAAAADFRSVRLSLLDPVPYGPEFFELVGRYHAVLVPSLTDEQPRVVFDAYARAVPIIASETGGLRTCVAHGKTGWLVPVGDVAALAAAIERANGSASELRSMGLAALRESRELTHQAMHRWRSRLIVEHCS